MVQDLIYALRGLRKQLGFTLVVLTTLALGVGGTTALYSVIRAVMLRPLPFEEPERLMRVVNRNSYPDMEDWIEQNESFETFAGYNGWALDWTGGDEPERIGAAIVTGELFPMLGVPAMMGRVLTPEDNLPGGERVVLLSHSFWLSRLGGEPEVMTEPLSFGGNPYTVVGVMPPGFRLPEMPAELWIPHRVVSPETAAARGVHFLIAIGRLREAASLASAQADMDAIATRLEELYPEENTGRRFRLMPWRQELVSDHRSSLFLLLGAVVLVLWIACANVAGLLLARAARRHREMGIRAALGATRSRLFRQLLAESLLLSVGGGGLGLLLAAGLTRLFVSMAIDDVPRLPEVSLDAGVLVFALLLSIATGLVFGLAPAIHSTRLRLVESLKEGGRLSSRTLGGAPGFRSGLVVLEVALAVVLLIGAGLLIRSFQRLQSVDPGFEKESLLTMELQLPLPDYGEIPKRISFFTSAKERLESLPGVRGVALVTDLPFGGGSVPHNLAVEGLPVAPGSEPEIYYRGVSHDYFGVMEIPLLEGRGFTEADRAEGMPVALVNEAFARQMFPGEDPIGRRIRWARRDEPRWMTIVGLVSDIKPSGLDSDEVSAVYVPFTQEQDSWRNWMNLVVRSEIDPEGLVASVKSELARLSQVIPVANLQTMERRIGEAASARRFQLFLLLSFAVAALFLAAVGLYGLLSYLVSERTSEIGIRMALGAGRSSVTLLILRQAVTLALGGILLGSLAAHGLSRFLTSQLFQIGGQDPETYAVIGLVLLLAALLAGLRPAFKAAGVDPLRSIRYE